MAFVYINVKGVNLYYTWEPVSLPSGGRPGAIGRPWLPSPVIPKTLTMYVGRLFKRI